MRGKVLLLTTFLFFSSCDPKELLYNQIESTETSWAVYRNHLGELDSIQMGFGVWDFPILPSSKGFKVVTKGNLTKEIDEMRIIDIKETSMQYIGIETSEEKLGILKELEGSKKEIGIEGEKILVYNKNIVLVMIPKIIMQSFSP